MFARLLVVCFLWLAGLLLPVAASGPVSVLDESRVWASSLLDQTFVGAVPVVSLESHRSNAPPRYDVVSGDSVSPASGTPYKHGLKYDPRVRARGVQDPKSHNFPYSFDDGILATKPTVKPSGYKIYQKPGTMNGKDGVFEMGVTKDGVIDHRFFRPNK